ncbi:MAG: hypothetical protein ABIG63_09035 [Chloroflexota bacterium]
MAKWRIIHLILLALLLIAINACTPEVAASNRPAAPEITPVASATAMLATITPTPVVTKFAPASTAMQPSPTPMTVPAIIAYPTHPPAQKDAVTAARVFLADHLGLPENQVRLQYSVAMTWTDTSLGCPDPGEVYKPVGVSGFQIIFQTGTRQYEIHTDEQGKRIVLCPGPSTGERIPLHRAMTIEEIVDLAREHLAKSLDVPIETVEVVSVEETEFSDDGLGCPKPPGKYPDRAYPGPIPGYCIILSVDGTQYEYHSGGRWLVFCGYSSTQ